MTNFKQIEPGHYSWNIGYGFKATIIKGRKSWLGCIHGPQGQVTVLGDDVEYWGATKKDVELALTTRARTITVKQTNLMSGLEFDLTITTPWCCNPAGETYWSM